MSDPQHSGSTAPGRSSALPRIDVLLEGFPLGSDAGHFALCAVLLIEGPGRDGQLTRILVDPAHVGRRTFLWEALAARQLTPQSIDLVVLTHAHWDHVQNIDVFAHAPVVMHAAERRYCQRPHPNDWATPAWTGDILERMDIRETGEGDELIDGVGIIELAGHSAGSIGVTVHTQSGLCLITGDALHYASAALTRRPQIVFWDERQARTAIDRAVGVGDILYPGHDQAFRLTGADHRIEYLRPFRLQLVGASPDRPGLSFQSSTRDPWVMPGIDEQATRMG